MKYLILIALFSVQAMAVQTKKCPEQMTLSINEVQAFSNGFIDQQIKDYMEVDWRSILEFLDGGFDSFELSFELMDKSNSTCSYRYEEADGSYVSVKIAGPDRDPRMVFLMVNNLNDMSLHGFASPTSKEKIYDFTGSTIQLKASAEYREWDATLIKYISIGKGVVTQK